MFVFFLNILFCKKCSLIFKNVRSFKIRCPSLPRSAQCPPPPDVHLYPGQHNAPLLQMSISSPEFTVPPPPDVHLYPGVYGTSNIEKFNFIYYLNKNSKFWKIFYNILFFLEIYLVWSPFSRRILSRRGVGIAGT